MRTTRHTIDGYQPIADYAAIGNLYTVALVGRDGSLDWCCLPHLDAPSVFGALLDHQRGGRFRVALPEAMRGAQRYLPGTNVLETTFAAAAGGRLVVTDYMPLRGPILDVEPPPTAAQLYRVARCEGGPVELDVTWAPRFDYARARTAISLADGVATAAAGDERLSLAGLPADAMILETDADGGPMLRARLRLAPGETVPLVTWYGDGPRWGAEEWEGALQDTVSAWREWIDAREPTPPADFAPEWQDSVERSGLVLKLLTYPHTGAIAAAATTSLPERIGGVRNWDYRYSWVRDASMTAQALTALGHRAEALDFLRFAEDACRTAETSARPLRVMYDLRGGPVPLEIELAQLEGYRRSRPVRVGNAAAGQFQLDIYGALLDSAYELLRLGGTVDEEMWAFLARAADAACDQWREPDEGIWEVRGGRQHFVFSKVMAWVALDRALRLAGQFALPVRDDRWRQARDEIRDAVLAQGYDATVGAFVQAFGSTALDAANLLIPIVGFLPPDDPRVQGTIDRTLEHLTENGLVYRYRADDGLPGGEGTFGLATFWLVDALALSGRLSEARRIFDGMVRRANHVGLFAEEIDARTGELLGNFPQAFTHIGLINSALYIAEAEGRAVPQPAPMGAAAER